MSNSRCDEQAYYSIKGVWQSVGDYKNDGTQRPITLLRLQVENDIWSCHNFPGKQSVDPLLGVVEEVGELSHAYLKSKQGIRGSADEHKLKMQDAIGDIIVYLADFCNQNNLDLQTCVDFAWYHVRQRDWREDANNGGVQSNIIP